MFQFFGMLLGGIIGSFIGAVILRAAVKWVQKRDIYYGQAYLTTLMSFLFCFLSGIVVGVLVKSLTGSTEAVNIAAWPLIPVGFLIQSWVINLQLEIPFPRACLVSLVMLGISLAIAVVMIPIFLAVNAITGGH